MVVDLNVFESIFRAVGIVRHHHSYRLTGVPDFVRRNHRPHGWFVFHVTQLRVHRGNKVSHLRPGHDGFDPRQCGRCTGIDRPDAGVPMWTAQKHSVQRARQLNVVDILTQAPQVTRIFNPFDPGPKIGCIDGFHALFPIDLPFVHSRPEWPAQCSGSRYSGKYCRRSPREFQRPWAAGYLGGVHAR